MVYDLQNVKKVKIVNDFIKDAIIHILTTSKSDTTKVVPKGLSRESDRK